mmetsp:Transcript_25065/g.64737  ORF Transcript_25065/g.64737 Transcript_25065/m.64737 type:complete len:400 (+) Transcript_25065:114-1313(+)
MDNVIAREHETRPLLRQADDEEEERPLSPVPPERRSVTSFRDWAVIACLLGASIALVACSVLLLGRRTRAHGGSYRPINITLLEDGFTVVLNTFRRNACLQMAFEHWASCNAVAQIRVSWSDVERRPPLWLRARATAEPERFVIDSYKYNRLSNRFRPLERVPTDALFSVDDDLFFSCDLMAEAHGEWRKRRAAAAARGKGAPMVGFAPRLLVDGPYDWPQAFRKPFIKNTLFVTKGAFLSRDDFELFWRPEFAPLVRQVDEHTTAEDISMSVVFAATRRVPPVHVGMARGQLTELCCSASTVFSEGIAAVKPRSAAKRMEERACRKGKRTSLHARTASFRLNIQREAVKLAGDAVMRINTTEVVLLPSTLRLLDGANASTPTLVEQSYKRARLVGVRL